MVPARAGRLISVSDEMSDDAPSAAPAAAEAAGVLRVVEEELEVGRRRFQTGAVRVRKLVHDETVEVPGERVTERVITQRVPIGRVVQQPPAVRHEGDTIVVPILEERIVLHTELVLVEELRITRRREVQAHTEAVTLRRESAVVERLDPATGQWDDVDPPAPTIPSES